MKEDNLKNLCKTIGRDLAELHKGDTVSALWPFITNEAEFYIGEFFMRDLYQTILKLVKKGNSSNQISKLFYRPSKIAQYFTLFHSTKFLEIKERRKLATYLLDFINYYRKDTLCSDRTNILKQKVFERNLLNIPLQPKKEVIEIEKGINSLLLMYLELLNPTAMRLGYEFHGPYKTNRKLLLIKEFYNLKSKHFKFSKIFPFESIILVEEVKEKPEVDFFNHLFYMPKRKAVAILINGKLLNEKRYKEVFLIIKQRIKEINFFCSNLSKKDWLKVLAEGYFYSIEKLKKELKIKISIPKKLFQRIDKEEFVVDVSKIKKSISKTPLNQLEEKIANSFYNIFKNGNKG